MFFFRIGFMLVIVAIVMFVLLFGKPRRLCSSRLLFPPARIKRNQNSPTCLWKAKSSRNGLPETGGRILQQTAFDALYTSLVLYIRSAILVSSRSLSYLLFSSILVSYLLFPSLLFPSLLCTYILLSLQNFLILNNYL